MALCIVTGTNTDVGKTIAVAALSAVLTELGHPVTVIKPVQTGEPDGAGDIYTAKQFIPTISTAEFIRYPEPLAPNIAAHRANMEQLDCAEVVTKIRDIHQQCLQQANREGTAEPVVLVEGAGGLLVRLGDTWTIADVAAGLSAPVVVVTSTGLGSLNLAELTVEAARRRGLSIAAVLGGSVPAKPDLATRLNLQLFSEITQAPWLGALPEHLGGRSKEAFAAAAFAALDCDQLRAALNLSAAQ
ncbi:dethiobiotin synthase [Corynebacterium choanae]|uniref:ATP-dependent dethiobiotin synthetase BioD n=1 Tax=Corynebacterium choanae TaxID=1862358 RepID=A0A3G6J6V1_9CORY|nr:dethiobiotin synthase [Corynebacterium choanae]AZA13493.1 ATP-dependent dethiobiotin synthetase BioD [Corynebacterium choanae]